MSCILVRRLSRLRSAYPTLLRLGCDNHPRRLLHVLLKRKHNTPSAAWVDPGSTQRFAVTPYHTADADVDSQISENMYAHNFFLNSLKYANTVMRPTTTYAHVTNEKALNILHEDWSSMTSAETASAVKKLSYNICHSGEEKIEPVEYMTAFNSLNLQNMTNDDLITMMQHLVPLNSHLRKYSFYSNLCLRIDNKCLKHFLKLPREKILYLCDIMYQMMIGYHDKSQYVWYSIRNLGNKPNKLNPQQVVQILFFLSIYRKPSINMYELEFRLEQCIDELSINELAIAMLGFFKTKTKIRNKDFLIRIIQKTTDEIDMVHTVSIAALVKIIRYSTILTDIKTYIKLLKTLTPYEPRYTLQSLTHIAQACGRIALYEKELMDKIIERLNKELKTARLKDFERILYTCCIFNIDLSNNIYQNIIKELRTTLNTIRAVEMAKFPVMLPRILGYLASQNIFPIDLIKHVMTSEYINKVCYGNYRNLSREYCVLDYSLRIEVPEYNGPFLEPVICNFLQKKYYDMSMENFLNSKANLFLTDILTTCQELFKTTLNISAVHALPHFTTQDIVFCIDERNCLVSSKEFLSQFKSSDIKRVDKKNSNNVRWIALVISHHGLQIRNDRSTQSRKSTGFLAAKIRQLSIIGYTPIVITHVSWDAHKSQWERCNYIKKLVFRNNELKLSNII